MAGTVSRAAALERRARGVDAWLGRREWLVGPLAGVAFVLAALPPLLHRPLWFDELFTLYLTRFDDLAAFWVSLSSSGDFNPPLHYLLAAALRGVGVGVGDELAVRLPAFVAFLCLLGLTYAWVSRLLSPLFGWLATLFLARYAAFATEGRPYALMLALFVAVLFLRWRRLDGRAGRRELPLLALCVALGASAHLYFVPFLVLLLGVEAVRSWRRATWDGGLWLACGLGLVPCLVYWPILRYFQEFSAPGYWSVFEPRAIGRAYRFLAGPDLTSWLPLAALAVVHVLRPAWFPSAGGRRLEDSWTTALAFAGGPLAGGLAAALTGGHFASRHYLVAGLGIALGLALAAWRLSHGSRLAGLAMVIVMAIAAAQSLAHEAYRARFHRDELQGDLAFLAKRTATAPILTCNPLWAFRIAHYAPTEDPEPIVFCDPEVPERSANRSLLALGDRAPLRLLSLDSCLALSESPRVLLHGVPDLDCFGPKDGPPRERGARRPSFVLYRLLAEERATAP
jgi:hypothetical protein